MEDSDGQSIIVNSLQSWGAGSADAVLGAVDLVTPGTIGRFGNPNTNSIYAYSDDIGQWAGPQILIGGNAGNAAKATSYVGNLSEKVLAEAAASLSARAAVETAANTGIAAIKASARVAPWAGNSLSRLSCEGETMYRVWGGGADQAGSWLTPIRPVSSVAAREGLALPAENAATYVSRVTLPPGVRMQVGTAAPAFGQPGGWAQAQLLERIPLSSFGKGEILP
ncbi:TNT domain-containing protein [Cellulomonas sp. PSBB021]|uniref:TNT domain-containing protein n=1 Tax=Cellulomonas sp. PSBB021 TaxID=2003551 RepID=UPI001E370D12|nr:TNT domain-containing protein [Cellulomonas sp. PSBB021]